MIENGNSLDEDSWGITTWGANEVPKIIFKDRVTGRVVYEWGPQASLCCLAQGCCPSRGKAAMEQLKKRIQGFIVQ